MSGVIEDGQAVVLEPVDVAELRVGDAVFVAWKRSFLLHLVVELDPTRVRIGNAKGRINGWSPRSAVLGRAVGVRAKAAKDGR